MRRQYFCTSSILHSQCSISEAIAAGLMSFGTLCTYTASKGTMAFAASVLCCMRQQQPFGHDNVAEDQHVKKSSEAMSEPLPLSPISASVPVDRKDEAPTGDSTTYPANGEVPRFRRSKIILTRRVHSVNFAPSHHADRPYMSRNAARQNESLPPPAPLRNRPFRPENFLDPDAAIPGYFFSRGQSQFVYRRRSGDPSARFLELRHGLISPGSPHARQCANPRLTNRLRLWYTNAIRWQALHSDFRPVLPLTPKRLVTPPELHKAIKPGMGKEKQVGAGDGHLRESHESGKAYTNHSSRSKLVEDSPLPLSPLLVNNGTSVARSLARSPRIIVIGDVHGCIDEFQSLLRLADFQPGDQVVLLGDLVAKGPDSVGVVKMARDIGARSVRGNHDHEVIRWCEAHSKGFANAMISPEHSQIASSLSPTDYSWLLEAPWFISAPDTQHLFVHAGFIPGVRLNQQNPRLMMNMRSVLTDGTVTAKNVPDCEWARLWHGPQTVVFGHDAHRGLQQHEFAKGIDTGCVYGGRLTALLLPEDRFISVAAKRSYILERGKFRNTK